MASDSRFSKILEPGRIGPVKTRNRIIKTGAAMCYWHEDDLHMGDTIKAYYEAIARGGVGLLVIEAPTVDYPLGARRRTRYRIDDDRYIEGLSELVEVIHKHNCPTFMQMEHDGPWKTKMHGATPLFEGQPVAASAVKLDIASDFHNEMPRPLTPPEIQEIIDKFASAAVRAQKAGFDGVDINSASTHLLHNFLSPFWNRREDAYGGNTENRSRFLASIIKEIKKRAGKDFGVSIVMNGIEIGSAIGIKDSDCLTLEESKKIAKILQDAGADAIQVRSHWIGYHVGGFLPEQFFYPESPIPMESIPPEYNRKWYGAAANIYMAEEIKKGLSIPVTVVGRMDPVIGEKILREGKVDFIAMTRRLQADPELPNKLAAGKFEDIAPCTACASCLDQTKSMQRRCRINGALGTTKYTISRAPKKKKVLVVGGGPAGMEAARVAATRGHDVTLYEKSNQLGGLLPLASMIKGTEIEDIPAIIKYFKRQLSKLGVKVKLGKEVDSSVISQVKPDVVILANGGKLTVPEIEGINSEKVLTTPKLHSMSKPYLKFFGPKNMEKLSKFWLPIGKKVVVIGGDMQGCETAEFLVKRRRDVTIIEKGDVVGEGIADFKVGLLMDWFQKKGTAVYKGVKNIIIADDGVHFTTSDGTEMTIEADTVIPASYITPDTAMVNELKDKVAEVYAIGDCAEPGLIVDAVGAAWQIGNKI